MNKLNIQKIWIPLVFAVSISFFAISCTEQEEYSPNKNFYKKPVQTLDSVVVFRSSNGEVYSRLETTTALYFGGDSARTVFPKGIKVLFYNKDLSDKSLLTAGYAVNYTSSSNLVYLKDSVKIINFNTPDTVYCEDLYWDQDKKIIYTDNSVKRYTQGGETFGDGLSSNEQFDSVVIIHPHGRETVEDSREE